MYSSSRYNDSLSSNSSGSNTILLYQLTSNSLGNNTEAFKGKNTSSSSQELASSGESFQSKNENSGPLHSYNSDSSDEDDLSLKVDKLERQFKSFEIIFKNYSNLEKKIQALEESNKVFLRKIQIMIEIIEKHKSTLNGIQNNMLEIFKKLDAIIIVMDTCDKRIENTEKELRKIEDEKEEQKTKLLLTSVNTARPAVKK